MAQTPDPRSELASDGESRAGAFLVGLGYLILERNFRSPLGEIDLIALDGSELVFVEVKTRRDSGGGRPAEAVTPRKQRRIGRVALGYLQKRDWLERDCRFDVVEVCGAELCHLIDAFRL